MEEVKVLDDSLSLSGLEGCLSVGVRDLDEVVVERGLDTSLLSKRSESLRVLGNREHRRLRRGRANGRVRSGRWDGWKSGERADD